MSKTCPNCGVNSPDNAKFCIECAYDLSDVPVNEINEEEKPAQKASVSNDSEKGNVALGCIIMVVIIIAIVGVGFFVLGSGGDNNNDTQTNIQLTFDEVYVYDFDSGNKTFYNYNVNGFFNNIPDDANTYLVKVIYYDSNGRELTSTTERLSKFESSQYNNYAATLSSYQTENYIDVDHVSVQIIKDNMVLNEFNSTINKNKLTHIPNSSNSTNTLR